MAERSTGSDRWDEAGSTAVLAALRDIVADLPEVTERPSHGSPAWFVRDKKTIAMFVDDHHGDGHLGIWCAAPAGAQEVLIETEPDRFYRPPYVGHRGWIGVDLAIEPDWDEVRAILVDAYRCIAPKTLIAVLDANDPDPDALARPVRNH